MIPLSEDDGHTCELRNDGGVIHSRATCDVCTPIADDDETLGSCGCTDYHMADCPTRTGGSTYYGDDDDRDPYAGYSRGSWFSERG